MSSATEIYVLSCIIEWKIESVGATKRIARFSCVLAIDFLCRMLYFLNISVCPSPSTYTIFLLLILWASLLHVCGSLLVDNNKIGITAVSRKQHEKSEPNYTFCNPKLKRWIENEPTAEYLFVLCRRHTTQSNQLHRTNIESKWASEKDFLICSHRHLHKKFKSAFVHTVRKWIGRRRPRENNKKEWKRENKQKY